jgi:D-allose transport system permease protein
MRGGIEVQKTRIGGQLAVYTNGGRARLAKLWKRFGIVAVLVALVAGAGALSPDVFFSSGNLLQVLIQSTTLVLVSVGIFFTILLAGIDLSVGSVLGLTGMVSAKLMMAGVPFWLAGLAGILCGAGFGFFNGALVSFTRLHSFIITLGTLSILRGVTLIVSGAQPVFGFDPRFIQLFSGRVLGVPTPIVFTTVLTVILALFAGQTLLGRNFYAVGGNAQAAFYSGISVRQATLLAFTISGACAGLAGMLVTARTGAAEPNAGTGLETAAIAAAIIGGTSFFGGRGRVGGVVLGALIISIITNILNIFDIQSYYQRVVMGSLIIVAVAVDRLAESDR